MNSLSYTDLAKRMIGLAGVVVAGATVVLPASAQVNSAPSTPSGVESSTTPLDTKAPAGETPSATEIETPASQAPSAPEAPSAKPEAEAPAPEAPGVAAASGTIVDIASASDSFKTLVAALTESELDQVLQGEGPYTVFAPTDEAFEALPAGTVEELLKPENRDRLVQILSYHVVSGEVTSEQLTSGEVPTVEGSPVNVTVEGSSVKVNDANVTQADIQATNGVIHAIDRVILPPDM